MTKIHLPDEYIARVINDWLSDEINESSSIRNAYLDNFDQLRTEISDGNTPTSKATSHFNRYEQTLKIYQAGMSNDFFMGKIIHHSLMFVSGGFRRQSASESHTQQEYRLNRRRAVSGVVMQNVVRQASDMWDIEAPMVLDKLQLFIDKCTALNKTIYDLHQTEGDDQEQVRAKCIEIQTTWGTACGRAYRRRLTR